MGPAGPGKPSLRLRVGVTVSTNSTESTRGDSEQRHNRASDPNSDSPGVGFFWQAASSSANLNFKSSAGLSAQRRRPGRRGRGHGPAAAGGSHPDSESDSTPACQ